VNTSNEKLESNSSAESEKKGRYGIIVTDYSCDGGHWKWNRIPERETEKKETKVLGRGAQNV
jgi:hypothetical protein